MSTSYDEIFHSFTSKIQDEMFSELSEANSEAQMIQLLNDGLINFKNPKINVFDKNDTTQIFNVDLTYHEIQIISNLMKLAWLDRQINNINLIKQKFSNKDFRLTSQASHLDALIKLRDIEFKNCKYIMKQYTHTTISDDGLTPDFSYLASDDE
jgi:hypothetical protein